MIHTYYHFGIKDYKKIIREEARMKFHMFSIVVGDSACIAKCPFCVSGEAVTKENINLEPLTKQHWARFETAAKLADRSGVDTVMFTSRGETTLYPDEITEYLLALKRYSFPFVELQTNGLVLSNSWDKYEYYLRSWFNYGMNTITISTVSDKKDINAEIYTPHSEYIDLKDLIAKLHRIGFSVRLTCVMCKDWMDTPEKVQSYLDYAKSVEAEQVTMRPLNDEYRRESAQVWIEKHKMTEDQKMAIWEYLNEKGTALLELPRVGTIFDVGGQNVMFSKPLTKYTRDTNPENGRNLILFRNGHLAYEWEMDGGVLL